ncbi:hypothetical protein POM88_045154 [Heracleum sosnowskyi]|uniref:Reverse transcriptase zinc-binding domain-containing protein n=1 Tax=Heracleum sosnowskyi TaxID=360622 RepID=A0AAD8H451_9APIA|nr:hypothetical protein POM88_045154 [Heracleum sosnowskyi]
MLNSVNRFFNASGLKPNPLKSACYFCNVDQDTVQSTLTTSGFSRGSFPFKYLGLPLITGRLSATDCKELTDKLCNRIDHWTSRFLRYSGRLLLLKTVLFSIQGYWASYLFLPKGVLKHLQSLFGRFLWGGNVNSRSQHKVSWHDCCLPKNEGGLGIRDLTEWNRAAIFYQIWRLSKPHADSLWILWLHECLFKQKSFWTASLPSSSPWCLKEIMNLRQEAKHYIFYSIGRNSGLKLWHDPWINHESLVNLLGPDIISIEGSFPLAPIRSIIANGIWSTSRSNHMLAMDLRCLISTYTISREDKVFWQNNHNPNISIIWHSFRNSAVPPPWVPMVWHSLSIQKCAFFMWLMLKKRLLTKDKMIRFGFNVNPRCTLCYCQDETVQHLFVECPYSYLVLKSSPIPLNINWADWEIGNFIQGQVINLHKRLAWLFISVAIYSIWKERNNRLHNNGPALNVDRMIYMVKLMVKERVFSSKEMRSYFRRNPSFCSVLF